MEFVTYVFKKVGEDPTEFCFVRVPYPEKQNEVEKEIFLVVYKGLKNLKSYL